MFELNLLTLKEKLREFIIEERSDDRAKETPEYIQRTIVASNAKSQTRDEEVSRCCPRTG